MQRNDSCLIIIIRFKVETNTIGSLECYWRCIPLVFTPEVERGTLQKVESCGKIIALSDDIKYFEDIIDTKLYSFVNAALQQAVEVPTFGQGRETGPDREINLGRGGKPCCNPSRGHRPDRPTATFYLTTQSYL